ncbi:MAG: glucosaminidase domain-containing protein [Pseudomonadota bacterium]
MQIGLTTPVSEPAAKADPQLQEAAEAFEGAFLKILLKSMRATLPEGGIFDRQQMAAYEEMRDGALADSLAKRRATGIADLLVEQLGGGSEPARMSPTPIGSLETAAAAGPVGKRADTPADAQSFVDQLLPAARKVADLIKVDPRVIVAQAALETGWGQHVPQRTGGRASHNLFGIKAGSSWSGPVARQTTTEYLGGKLHQVVDAFRAYSSEAESLADYVKLIATSPRYQAAREAATPEAYLQALQDAGYATDPEYAAKIQRVLKSPELRNANDD